MVALAYRFIADAMLGRLSRWMRVLGYDVEYARGIEDAEILKRVLEEGRILLTRDTLLIRRRLLKGRFFFVEGDDFKRQLGQIVTNFPIDRSKFLTRCLLCNALLERMSKKEEVKGRVPGYVYLTQDMFSVCPLCRRIYWAGTHRERMLALINSIPLKGF